MRRVTLGDGRRAPQRYSGRACHLDADRCVRTSHGPHRSREKSTGRLGWTRPASPHLLEFSRVTTPSSTPLVDTVENAAATPEREQPYGALGLKPDEYAQIREILGRRPTSGELAMYSVMWSEHCSYKSSKIYLRQFGQKVTDEMNERPHGRHGPERRRRRRRRGLGGHLQGRVAQPPELHRAVPGRRDRRRRHRPRHHLDGRAPGRDHGPAALRRDRPPRHRPRRARRHQRHLVLRQLPRPAQHRRRDGLRRRLPGQPARQRPRGRRHAPRGHQARERHRRRQQGRALRRPHRRRRHRRSIHPRLRHVRGRRPDQAPRRAGRRPVRREGAHRVLPRAVPGRPRRGDPGPRRRRHLVRHQRAGRQRQQRHEGGPRQGAAARSRRSRPKRS